MIQNLFALLPSAVCLRCDMQNRVSTVLKFDERIRRVRELSSVDGKLSSMKLRNHEAPVSLKAGEAKLFKVSR